MSVPPMTGAGSRGEKPPHGPYEQAAIATHGALVRSIERWHQNGSWIEVDDDLLKQVVDRVGGRLHELERQISLFCRGDPVGENVGSVEIYARFLSDLNVRDVLSICRGSIMPVDALVAALALHVAGSSEEIGAWIHFSHVVDSWRAGPLLVGVATQGNAVAWLSAANREPKSISRLPLEPKTTGWVAIEDNLDQARDAKRGIVALAERRFDKAIGIATEALRGDQRKDWRPIHARHLMTRSAAKAELGLPENAWPDLEWAWDVTSVTPLIYRALWYPVIAELGAYVSHPATTCWSRDFWSLPVPHELLVLLHQRALRGVGSSIGVPLPC